MTKQVSRSLRAAMKTNFAMLRSVSALRRTAIIAVVLVGGTALWGADVGYRLAVGAVFGGFLDRGDTSTRVAAHASFLLAGTTFVMTFLTAAITSVVASVAVVAVCAAVAGAASAVSLTAARVWSFTAVLSVIGAFTQDSPAQAAEQALWLAAGVLAQAIGTWITSLTDTDITERRRVSQALIQIARSLDEVSHSPGTRMSNRPQMATTLAIAETTVHTWDLPEDRVAVYAALLNAAQDCRAEAVGSAYRAAGGWAGAASSETLRGTGEVLRASARMLTTRNWSPIRRSSQLTASLAALPDQVDDPDEAADRVLTRAAMTIADKASWLVEHPHFRRRRLPRTTSRFADVRAGVRVGQRPFLNAVRMGLAAVIGCTVGLLLGGSNAAWIAMTAIVVLRPDIPSTLVRTIARAMGTLIGCGLVLAVVFIAGPHPLALLIAGMIFAFFGYMTQLVNYFYFVAGMVGVVILLETVIAEDPLQAATVRLADVVIGSAIAVVLSLIVRVQTSPQVPTNLARYAEATSRWLHGLQDDVLAGAVHYSAHAEQRRTMRAAGHEVRQQLGLVHLEQDNPGLEVGYAELIESEITACLRDAQAVVAPLLECAAANPTAASHVAQAATDLHSASTILDSHGTVRPRRSVYEVELVSPGRIGSDTSDEVTDFARLSSLHARNVRDLVQATIP